MADVTILDLPMPENDADAKTVRDYLKALLSTLWREGESFSGKHPFGNSGWQVDIYAAMADGGVLPAMVDKYGELDIDEPAADKLIQAAIAAL